MRSRLLRVAAPRGWFERCPTRAGLSWLAVGLVCIGLLVLFRQVIRPPGALGRLLAENQYAAYFWHVLLIVALQLFFLDASMGPLAKFALVTLAGVPLVFLWSHLLRRVPLLRAVL